MNSFNYDIHGLVRVRSARRLPELELFLSTTPVNEPDIDVRVVANPARHRVLESICYDEKPGRFGFSITINQGFPIEVFASPLVGASPHVLYTNVVEPLLRWTLVRKGYALMHGACLAFDNEALFITARTDTGKTTTLLYTLRANPECQFLSDDMTIFGLDGMAYSFPKPLTISQHTLQAIGGAPLTVLERLFLLVQSRLHSRGGRSAGMWLHKAALPAATLSAVVQKLIPPPKFQANRLVPGTPYAKTAQLARVVVIERGPDEETPLAREEMLDVLAANAEDAYGFPPYPAIAKRLSQWQGHELAGQERAIVAAATQGLPATLLSSDHYGWYEHLPRLINTSSWSPPTPNVGVTPTSTGLMEQVTAA